MKNDQVMPNRRSRAKVAAGLMLTILATFFEISTLNLFGQLFTLWLVDKPIVKLIGLNLAIWAYKNLQKTQNRPHLETCFFQSVFQIMAYNFCYDKYFCTILF